MRWIYLSPHFDDAILSCGGLIWEQTHKGNPVEIWTVCAGDAPPGPLSPLAMMCHQEWGLKSAEDVVTARRIENLEAATITGLETVDFNIPDCIYRRSPTGELLYPEDVFAPIHPFEAQFDAAIAAVLISELRTDDNVVSPLAIGGHLDHVLTRLAAERLDQSLWYYSDIPYHINNPIELDSKTKNLEGKVFSISTKGLDAWQNGIAAYSSQIRILFETREKMQAAIRLYWEELHGIRLWSAAKK
jgi:LmbE family N-acetylglucosaminyl deacetylase